MISDHFFDCAENAGGAAGDLGLVEGKLMWRRRGPGNEPSTLPVSRGRSKVLGSTWKVLGSTSTVRHWKGPIS